MCIYDRAELYIDVVVAAYNLVQLGLGWYNVEQKTSNPKWFSYLLDQVCRTLFIYRLSLMTLYVCDNTCC